MRRSVIIGTGSYIPSRRVHNDEFLNNQFFLDYGDPIDVAQNQHTVDRFREITEIGERRWVENDQLASDIGLAAAENALESAGIDKESLDYIIFAHNFGDVLEDNRRCDFCPTLAARVKQRLKIANPECVAYDLPFGCPGWVQGIIQADYYLRSGDASRALVIGAETLSRVCDPHDRDSMIYSDGAGAAVFEARECDEEAGILAHATRSDTLEHARLLWMGESYDPKRQDHILYLKMYGRKLYNYALTNVPGVVKKSLDRAGLGLDDVTKVFLHQANAKMDDAILKRIFKLYGVEEITEGIMPMTISWLGNSSVATVPTLIDLVSRGEVKGHTLNPGDTAILASVGAGMNINSVVYRWV
ncbi:MAG: ketoacyl-ACP synthase III [Acidobacteria bacterium]|nr:ketoacyl-ACP synthase III [Acidobacteriota bacterium]